MSAASYRLEAPRPRPAPPPLRLPAKEPPSRRTSVHNLNESQTLLYDLPSPIGYASATSPPPGEAYSPTSPSVLRSRSRTPKSGRPTPPPGHRHRSATPGAARNDLEKFAEHCRAWYYDQDVAAGDVMTATLKHVAASQRATYTRLQASIRSAYHAEVSARRNAEFQAKLSATKPGGSLMPNMRMDPTGEDARKERHARFEKFVKYWCTMGFPGTHPFFQTLWAILRLQTIPSGPLGGAGAYRLQWELDDAVFKESAGRDFMFDAVDVLKGVLAFEENALTRQSSMRSASERSSLASHARSQSQPLANSQATSEIYNNSINIKRPRAPSDPFLDNPTPSRSTEISPSYSSSNTFVTAAREPLSPKLVSRNSEILQSSMLTTATLEPEYSYRVWISPELSNPEILELLKIFPAFITQRTLPRFSATATTSTTRLPDIEEGGGESREEGREIHFGTGVFWISSRRRTGDWNGNWWSKFRLWWRRLFSCT